MKCSYGTLICVSLVLATDFTGASARQLLQVDEHTDIALREGTTVHDRLYNTSVTSDLAGMRGLWVGLGDQQPESPWESFDSYQLPNCAEHVGHNNYEHYNPYDDHFIMLAGAEGDVKRTTASHSRTTIFNVASYESGLIRMVNNATGLETCANWQPFIDLRTGELKAESVSIYLWTTNSTGGANYTSMTCEALGDEVPGCYTGDVTRSPEAVGMAASPPSLSADSPLMIRPEGSVISVAISTYTCRNGECLKYAPKYVHEEE